MKRIFLCLIFIPSFLSAHIQDERLFKTQRVPAAAILLLDRSGSMNCDVEIYDKNITLKRRSWRRPGRGTTLVGWYDSTLTSYQNMNNFNGDDANGDWIFRVEWDEYGWFVGSSSLNVSWILRVRDELGWHEYDGGSHYWTGSGLNERSDTIAVTGLGNVVDVLCYVNITTDDGLKMDNVGISLRHTPGPGVPSNRIEQALLVIHSLLDVNLDALVDENDEFPILLGQGFFDQSRVYVGGDSCDYEGDEHRVISDCHVRHNPRRWNQVSKTWVDDISGSRYLHSDPIGSSPATVWEHINTTEVDGYTPNGLLISRAVHEINQYRSENPELYCMKFSVVLVTDGETNAPRGNCYITTGTDNDKAKGAVELVRSAYLAFHGDENSDGKPDSIRVYAVGFGTGIKQEGANSLNWAARWGGTCADSSLISGDSMAIDPSGGCATSGGSVPDEINPQKHLLTGYAYIAEDAEALSSALVSIFMGIESQQNQSYTAAEVTSVEEEFLSTEYQSRLYVASFKPDSTPIWEGNLRAIKMVPGVLDLDNIPDSVKIWEAGDTIAKTSASSRPIYGIKSNGSMLPFDTLNFTAGDLDVSSASLLDVIKQVRGGGDTLGQLGDIFHSSPLRIQAPNYFYEDEGWDSFYNVMSKKRSALLYAGGNDGMLHVIADTIFGQAGKGGHEIAGIIPMNFVPKVKNLLNFHDYFVDGDPTAADVWFPANEGDSVKQWKEWHTVLIAVQGEGGNSFTAFDVTDPKNETSHNVNSLTFLFDAWQSDTLKKRLGFTTSTPVIHKVGVNWSVYSGKIIDRFYAFMGGGQFPDPMDISIVDSFPSGTLRGNNIIAFDVWKAATSGMDQSVMFIPPAGASMKYPFVASPAVVNINPQFGNRYDYLFIPDAAGQLWFVNLQFPNPSDWKARKIFQPPLPASSDSAEIYNWHPAYYYPLVWKDPLQGGYWIAYGTGNRSRIFDECSERFYALYYPIDAFSDTANIPLYTEDSLGVLPDESTDCGWMLNLTHDREKVVTPAIYLMDSLEFYTFSPGGAVEISPCEIGGSGSSARSYTFHIKTGAGNTGGKVIGTGIPQAPSYSSSLSGERKKATSGGGKIKVEELGSYTSFRQQILWEDEDRD